MNASPILKTTPLGFQWPTLDPFLFCVHHEDFYPAGNEQMGPHAPLDDRNLGNDFTPRDGWRMYHGETVPGFPVHPHRGFETVTVVQRGLVDHADSLGAAGRYGQGDVQWMTAGRGLQHAEMFPLLNQTQDNPAELFQIWLNLPRASKMVKPHFKMLWQPQIPVYTEQDKTVSVDVIAGALNGLQPLAPPPDSWAADPAHGVAIWRITLAPGAKWSLPAAEAGLNRMLYYFNGSTVRLDEQSMGVKQGMQLLSEQAIELHNGEMESQLLLLQGRPINEPVVQYGPFVMNTKAEIQQAFEDYQRTQFGGWPWPRKDPVHPPTQGRFARHEDGTMEEPTTAVPKYSSESTAQRSP